MRSSLDQVVLVPKLSVALKWRVEVRNCLEGGKSGLLSVVMIIIGIEYKKVNGRLSLGTVVGEV